MNPKYQFFIIAAVILIAAGCRVPITPVLSVSENSFRFPATGGFETFEVTSNVEMYRVILYETCCVTYKNK